ncbi:Pro-kuma-activ multi-domain protein [Pyrenophora teres f. maculata]|nr:Pro-kuma-activ multi-domain protein [Pyrenophora teres f. maculata]
MHFTNAFIAAIAACNALATPIARSPYAIKETHAVPDEWSKQERTHVRNTIQLQIGLKQGRFDELDRHLQEVSDPDSQRYGQYLTAEEVNELVAPSSETHGLVHDWLQENGIDVNKLSYSSAKDWIILHLPIDKVEILLDAEYHNYKHADGRIVSRTTRWSLPLHLHEHIDTIQPTTSFFRGAPRTWAHTIAQSSSPPTNSSFDAVCDKKSVTPECFQTLYGTKGYKTQATSKNSIGFANYLDEVPIRPDAKVFLEKYRPEAISQASAFTQISIAGGPVQDGPLTANQTRNQNSFEANLNVQTISGFAWEVPITSYSTGGRPPFMPESPGQENNNEPYLVWLDYLAQQQEIPKVISTSYGEPEQSVPRAYAERVCRQFAQVGARGTSLFFPSGNSGVGRDDKCFTNDGNNTYQFKPIFPGGCPYVTSVSATMGYAPEEVAYIPPSNASLNNYFAPGGGFSNYFARPAWQEGVVPKYVEALGEKYKGLYNAGGRGYPDIAAQGVNFAFFWNGTEGVTSGTSAATPLAAGVFALVNDALIAAGRPTLGFLNPWLYKKGYKALTDITKGNNRGCNTEGFVAGEGWDPVSGFGSPNFPKLVKLAMGEGY